MTYGNYNRGYNNQGDYNQGGYNQGGYNNQRGGQQGGYQQQPPAPVDIDTEINERIDIYLKIRDAITNRGLDPADFVFAIGGWTTSIVLKQKKGK